MELRGSKPTTSTSPFLQNPSPRHTHHWHSRDRHHRHPHHHDRRRESKKRRFDSSFIGSPGYAGSRSFTPPSTAGFADLPYDLLTRIAANFDLPNLRAACLVCRSWREALRPLRKGMMLFLRGKRIKHGSDGTDARGRDICQGRFTHGLVVRRDLDKALDYFRMGAGLGSPFAMVDAGLMYWEMGKKEEGRDMYRKAAELGHPAGQCNLATAYLQDEPQEPEKAVKWFYKAAISGYARAQYSLAICFHHGRGVKCNFREAAKWYLRAAEGGNTRAMYNVSLCYSMGEGLPKCHHQANVWLKRAAKCGHQKALFELGSQLISSGKLVKGLVYLELATRAGETDALPVKNEILQKLPEASIACAYSAADKWQKSLPLF